MGIIESIPATLIIKAKPEWCAEIGQEMKGKGRHGKKASRVVMTVQFPTLQVLSGRKKLNTEIDFSRELI